MKTIFVAIVLFSSTFSYSQSRQALNRHGLIEMKVNPKYRYLASGQLFGKIRKLKQRFPWPVKLLSIGHTIASYQKYGFSSPYFHHGVDMRANAGSDVLASRGGKVVNIENYFPGDPAYWEVAILDVDGFIWQYHHIRKDSIPAAIHEAFKYGKSVPAGTKLGEVYKWSVKSHGEYFHHIHLNILGEGGVYHNPLLFLRALPDKVAPKVTDVKLMTKRGAKKTVKAGEPYTLVAFAEDLILHKHFKVPPYHLWVSVNGSKPMTVWKFDSLPGGDSKTKFVHNFFIPKWTCGNYTCRRFAMNLGFFRGRQVAFPTTPGTHKAVIGVEDVYGNKSKKTFQWTVD